MQTTNFRLKDNAIANPPPASDKQASFRVRRARHADADALYQLIEPISRDGYLVPRRSTQLRRHIQDFFLVEKDGHIISCAALHPHHKLRVGEIACVATHRSYRGQGHGRRLLCHAEKKARQIGLRSLFLASAHTANWFVQYGFQELHRQQILPQRTTLPETERDSRILVKNIY